RIALQLPPDVSSGPAAAPGSSSSNSFVSSWQAGAHDCPRNIFWLWLAGTRGASPDTASVSLAFSPSVLPCSSMSLLDVMDSRSRRVQLGLLGLFNLLDQSYR